MKHPVRETNLHSSSAGYYYSTSACMSYHKPMNGLPVECFQSNGAAGEVPDKSLPFR
jgi:hypothetical protein